MGEGVEAAEMEVEVAAGAQEVAKMAAVVGVGWATEAVRVVAWVPVATAAVGWLEAMTAAATEVVRLAAAMATATEVERVAEMVTAGVRVAEAPRAAEEIPGVKEEGLVDWVLPVGRVVDTAEV